MMKDMKGGKYGSGRQDLANMSGGQRKDVLRLVVKIQAVFRGALTRRRVKAVYGFTVKNRSDADMVFYN